MTDPAPERPRRTRLSREARAAQLLDVAERLFAERGFEGTAMEDLARTAGVTRAVVYDHYPTKDDVFVACARRARAELEEKVREPELLIEAGADTRTVIRRAGDIFFGILERDPQRWMVLFNPSAALSRELSAELTAGRARTIDRIAEMVRRFGAYDESRTLAFAYAISGVGEQLGRWWLTRPDVPRATVVEHYCDFITAGLALDDPHPDVRS